MANYHYEKSLLESLIFGLKRLYNYLAEREIKKELLGQKDALTKSPNSIDDEENKQRLGVLQSLRDIYILKQKQEKAKRLEKNSGFLLFKLPQNIFIKNILCCLELKDIQNLCLVSYNFNQMVKSNVFLVQYIKIQEHTNIKVNLKAFSGFSKKPIKEEQKKADASPTKPEENKIDLENLIETQKRTKAFLSAKLQESDEKIKILKNDMAVMKSLLSFEKAAKEDAIEQTSRLEAEFKAIKSELEEKEARLSEKVSDLEARMRGKNSEYEQINEEVERLKSVRVKLRENHKQLLMKIDDLKEKNDGKVKIIQELVERFEKGANISTKADTSTSKSFSREEPSLAGTEENSPKPKK